jgi:putative peptidoglycan lipid II flippase
MVIVRVSDIESKVSYRAVSDVNSAAPSSTAPPRRFGGYAALVAAGILLSRVAGLIRNRAIAHYLGTSGAADAFTVAQKVPNILQNLLGEGVLSASFIPVYARLVSRGDEKMAGRVAGVFVSILALAVSVIVLIGVLLAPVLLKISAWGLEPEVLDLAITLVRIVFPGVGLLVISAWCLGVLNTHRQFFLSYIAPVLWNAAQIAALVIFGASLANRELSIAVAWGLAAGCALQLGIQLPFVFKHAKHLSFGIDWSLEPVRTIFRQLAPVVTGRGVVQLSGYLDQFIASFLPTGALVRLFYAQSIYILPISVFGMSIAAAELPQMAGERGSEEEINRALRKRLDRGIRQIAFFVVPTTAAFIVIGRLIVSALYQTGETGPQQSLLVWYMLIGSSVGLLVSTLGRIYQSTLYAMHDTRTPYRAATTRVVASAALAALLAFPLRGIFPRILELVGLPVPAVPGGAASLAVVGITLGSGAAAWIEYMMLQKRVTAQLGPGEPKRSYFTKIWGAAIASSVAAVAFDGAIGRSLANGMRFSAIVEFLMAAMVFGVVYFTVGFVLRVPEARATIGRVMKIR